MSRFHRKTAPQVRDGRVQQKNNWSPSYDALTRFVVERQRPGDGYRHLLLKRDVERFVKLIPNWEKLAVGLTAVVLADGGYDCDGWYNRGVISLPAWPLDRLGRGCDVDPGWFRGHRYFLARIGATVWGDDPETAEVFWTPDTARAYQLCHVFLHELGHHADRMHTRTKCDNGPRGEVFAEDYAFDLEAVVLERYFREFGLPR